MSDITYVAITEDGWNYYVGDMDTITTWLYDNEIVLTECSFYELGKKIEVSLKVVDRR